MAPKKPSIKKRPTGRPKEQVDPVVAKAICDNLELGMPFGLAAECEGVPRRTFYDWQERYPSFAAQVSRAHAVAAKNLTVLSTEGGKGSSAAMWHLERRFRDDFSPPREEKATSEIMVRIEGGLPKRPRAT